MFARGEYIPLETRGPHAVNVCAFAQRLDDQWAIAAVPRWTIGMENWGDTEIAAPSAASDWPDALTGLIPASWKAVDLAREFPVALLGRFGTPGPIA